MFRWLQEQDYNHGFPYLGTPTLRKAINPKPQTSWWLAGHKGISYIYRHYVGSLCLSSLLTTSKQIPKPWEDLKTGSPIFNLYIISHMVLGALNPKPFGGLGSQSPEPRPAATGELRFGEPWMQPAAAALATPQPMARQDLDFGSCYYLDPKRYVKYWPLCLLLWV